MFFSTLARHGTVGLANQTARGRFQENCLCGWVVPSKGDTTASYPEGLQKRKRVRASERKGERESERERRISSFVGNRLYF